MQNLWVLQTGEPIHIDPGSPRPMRGMNLVNFLANKGHKVTFWTTDFDHIKKAHRFKASKEILISSNISINLIRSTGYSKNLGLARLFDHAVLALNFHRKLKTIKEIPDAVFIGFPPIEIGYILSRWLKKNNIPYIVDAKDQWPSTFIEAAPVWLRPIIRFILFPYFYLTKKLFEDAASLCSMSSSYQKWMCKLAKRDHSDSRDIIAPLTSNQEDYSPDVIKQARHWLEGKGIDLSHSNRFIFVGSISRAFNFEDIFIVNKLLQKKGIKTEFVIAGDGPLLKLLERESIKYSNIIWLGRIDSPKIKILASAATATIAPYNGTDNFSHNVPNKVIDSFMHGLPVITSLTGEVNNLIIKNNVGMVYSNDVSLEEAFMTLLNNKELVQEMSKNAQKLYSKNFLYEKVYGSLCTKLETLSTLNAKIQAR